MAEYTHSSSSFYWVKNLFQNKKFMFLLGKLYLKTSLKISLLKKCRKKKELLIDP